MLSSLLGAGTWHTALEKFLLHAQLTVAVLPGRGSTVPGEVFFFFSRVVRGSEESKGS